MQNYKNENIDKTNNKKGHKNINFWLIILFLSSSFVFLLLGFLQAKGSFGDKILWLTKTINPCIYSPSLIGLFFLTLIGYPFCLPLKKIFKEYIWLLAPLVGLAYWSLWILPSYLGLPFRLCLLGALIGGIVAYAIAWFIGALKKIASPKPFIGLAVVILVVSIFHMYPYSQFGLTSYSI